MGNLYRNSRNADGSNYVVEKMAVVAEGEEEGNGVRFAVGDIVMYYTDEKLLGFFCWQMMQEQ